MCVRECVCYVRVNVCVVCALVHLFFELIVCVCFTAYRLPLSATKKLQNTIWVKRFTGTQYPVFPYVFRGELPNQLSHEGSKG